MKTSDSFLPVLVLSFLTVMPLAIFSQDWVADKGSFGIDENKKIIVWHLDDQDTTLRKSGTDTSVVLDKVYEMMDPVLPLSPSKSVGLRSKGVDYTLYVSRLPIVHLTINEDSINDRKKIAAFYRYYAKGEYIESTMGIRHRGNLSLTFPKKSYDIEFWSDSLAKQAKDIKFEKLRSDDDWILDGLYNEPLRLRSSMSTRLWAEMHSPYYNDGEIDAKSGFDVVFVEVFKNGEYLGIYALSESIDRKQLGLKKHIGGTIKGELFKAESYGGATGFGKSPEFNNLFPHWGGFRMEYPLIDYRAHWNDLEKLVRSVATSTDDEFMKNIEKQVHMDNVIDYFLLVNLLRATDNLGKNYYLGRFDEEEPYFFVPWDLDGVLGIIQEGKRIPTTNDILSNRLFDRLLELNPNGYKNKLKARWLELRKTICSDLNIGTAIKSYYDFFDADLIYERERIAWPDKVSNENHYNYVNDWLKKRMRFLDTYFQELK